MKLAVASRGKDLDAQVDGRFGRASYFIVVDPESMEFEAIENIQNLNALQGAGVQAAQTVIESGADYAIAGHCGPKAFRTLSAAGVGMIVGIQGIVTEVVEKFRIGKLVPSETPDVEGGWI